MDALPVTPEGFRCGMVALVDAPMSVSHHFSMRFLMIR
jgi:hypothetical protein